MYTPVYHFARAAGLGLELDELRAIVVRESVRHNGLLRRIDGPMIAPVGSLDSVNSASKERQCILERLQPGDLDGLRRTDYVRLFEAVTHLELPNPPIDLLFFLADLMDEKLDKLSSHRSLRRKAVARLDEVLNRPASAQRSDRGAASRAFRRGR